jgi:hypothetical protein
MPERLYESQGIQVGVEATPGTAVDADRLLSAMSIMIAPNMEFDVFRPRGMMFPTISTKTRDETQGDLEGRMTYDELIIPVSSVWTAADVTTPTGGTNARQHEFIPNPTGPNEPISLTVERGDENLAERAAGVRINELTLTFTHDGTPELSGSLIGLRYETGHTLTADPTSMPMVAIQRDHVSIYVDDPTGLANAAAIDAEFGTTKLTRVRRASLSIGDRFLPWTVIDAALEGGPAFILERPGEHSIELAVMRDDAGMEFLNNARNGDLRLLRIEAIGPIIEGTIPYRMTIDMAVRVTGGGGTEDDDGGDVTTWTFAPFYSEVWEKAARIQIVNTQTALA